MEKPRDLMNEVDDDALLRLYAAGDHGAANALTHRFTPMAFRLAIRLLGNQAEAEDVTQEAMMRLWKIAPNWREGEAKISTWVYRVTSNLCMDRLRKQVPVRLDDIVEPLDDKPGVEVKFLQKDRIDALSAALAKLPERQRQAVVLRHLEGLSNPEIARILDLTVEAVESLTARAKKRLSALLLHRKSELGLQE